MLAPATLTLGSISALGCVPNHAHYALTLPIANKCVLQRTQSLPGNWSFFATNTAATRRASSVKTAVAAIATDQLSSSDSTEKQTNKKYYFVIANAKFMLDEEEHFQELLFERLRNYSERNIEQDFWLVIEPKFLEKFPSITSRLRRPAVALVSTNGTWITYMKLRLDRVLSESYEANSPKEALASNPVDIEFKKPENWLAPYPKYEFGWWEPFLPSESE